MTRALLYLAEEMIVTIFFRKEIEDVKSLINRRILIRYTNLEILQEM
jgi:hypothetical protein